MSLFFISTAMVTPIILLVAFYLVSTGTIEPRKAFLLLCGSFLGIIINGISHLFDNKTNKH